MHVIRDAKVKNRFFVPGADDWADSNKGCGTSSKTMFPVVRVAFMRERTEHNVVN